jgi:hypothetical protein
MVGSELRMGLLPTMTEDIKKKGKGNLRATQKKSM